MTGMDADTGAPLSGEAHIRQSLADILATPLGSRVARRDYGSIVPELIDQPANAVTRMRLFAATALAILRWEPRIRLAAVALEQGDRPGSYRLTLDGVRTDIAPAAARTRFVLPLGRSTAAAI